MTKKELVDSLKNWPDNAEVVVSVSKESDMSDPHNEEDKIWYELVDVEIPMEGEENPHCLLFGGKVVMC